MASVKWHLWKSLHKTTTFPNDTPIALHSEMLLLRPWHLWGGGGGWKSAAQNGCVDIFQHPITTRERVFSAVLGKRHVPAIREHSIPFRSLASTRARF